MIHEMYTIRDDKTEAYMQPFFQQTKGAAMRALSDLANDEKTMFSIHPQDFSCYYLGQFDDSTGQFNLLPAPEIFIKIIELQDSQ